MGRTRHEIFRVRKGRPELSPRELAVRATCNRWYDRYREGGIEALADHRSRPDRVWNRIPEPGATLMSSLAPTLRPAKGSMAPSPANSVMLASRGVPGMALARKP